MKRFAYIMLALVPSLLFAGGRTATFIDQVTGGSLSFTNAAPQGTTGLAYELDHVSFAIPSAACTNTFSIVEVVRYALPTVYLTAITTNTQITSGYSGRIETNTQRYAQGYVQYTNTWAATATTNDITTQYYDSDDFYDGRSVEWNDIQRFTFSYTNKINLKRVYTVHVRP